MKKYELTATKEDSWGRTIVTAYYPTRRAAETEAFLSRSWGWATKITKV